MLSSNEDRYISIDVTSEPEAQPTMSNDSGRYVVLGKGEAERNR